MAKGHLLYTVRDVTKPRTYSWGNWHHTVRVAERIPRHYKQPYVKPNVWVSQSRRLPVVFDNYGPPEQTYGPMYATKLNKGFIDTSANVDTTSYQSASAVFRLILMLVLLLAYCNVVFGTVEKSPFDSMLEIGQTISSLGSDAKDDIISTLKDFGQTLRDMNHLNPTNWGDDFSIGGFFTAIWGYIKAPFQVFALIFDFLIYLFKLVYGVAEIVLGLV